MADQSQFSEAQLTPDIDMAQVKATEVLKFKNKLQELAHKAVIDLPVYTVTNEGLVHAPCFRATVEIYGKSYTTTNVFKHRKEAEQEAARLALEDLGADKIEESIQKDQEQWTVEQALSFLPKLIMSSKSIFHEFATKEGADLPLPEYCTVPAGGNSPYFVSVTKYKEVTYPSRIGRSKKEAEQAAAYVAIENLLGDAKSAATLLPIIKSKANHFCSTIEWREKKAMHGEDPASHALFRINNIGASTGNPENMADLPHVAQASSDNVPPIPADHGFSLPIEFVHESGEQKPPTSSRKRRKNKRAENMADLPPVAQASSENIPPVPADHGFSLPIEFVPESGEQKPPTSSSRKKRKNKRGAKKRSRSGARIDANALPSVSQPMGVLG